VHNGGALAVTRAATAVRWRDENGEVGLQEWPGRAVRETDLKGQSGRVGRRAYQESCTEGVAKGESGTASSVVSPPASARPAETVVDGVERGEEGVSTWGRLGLVRVGA
jgi:hypothetical protein